ncbi:hypothetical protein THASP1DRAFT_28269 [Thamnocephalis sphaerospora]|uniref:Ubiquitin-like protease family profile domain-containing protein n=1 Tax=Thamnocephalis sphaerospora TaxID=78915 RepID=A0A4P9XUM9_9FUNG|nr:hypothetical protein THASP1DRAFT_28269 [Thamnocephalis sphaerospora]|eukprot:RKP09947.1 hypothetical protein THASP1DRAFT_28269 [Thamnocephalis sphaerospora]
MTDTLRIHEKRPAHSSVNGSHDARGSRSNHGQHASRRSAAPVVDLETDENAAQTAVNPAVQRTRSPTTTADAGDKELMARMFPSKHSHVPVPSGRGIPIAVPAIGTPTASSSSRSAVGWLNHSHYSRSTPYAKPIRFRDTLRTPERTYARASSHRRTVSFSRPSLLTESGSVEIVGTVTDWHSRAQHTADSRKAARHTSPQKSRTECVALSDDEPMTDVKKSSSKNEQERMKRSAADVSRITCMASQENGADSSSTYAARLDHQIGQRLSISTSQSPKHKRTASDEASRKRQNTVQGKDVTKLVPWLDYSGDDSDGEDIVAAPSKPADTGVSPASRNPQFSMKKLTGLLIGEHRVDTLPSMLRVTPKPSLYIRAGAEGHMEITSEEIHEMKALGIPALVCIRTKAPLQDAYYAPYYNPYKRERMSGWIYCFFSSMRDAANVIQLLGKHNLAHNPMCSQEWRALVPRIAPTTNKAPLVEPISPFYYPFSGIRAVEVTNDDFQRLKNGGFLNDSIIDFYLMQVVAYHLDAIRQYNPTVAAQTHVFSSFFYRKLTQRRNNETIAYDKVRSWTAKLDLFAKRHVLIPINENLHWYLALVGNLHLLAEKRSSFQVKKTDDRRHDGENESSDHEDDMDVDSCDPQSTASTSNGSGTANDAVLIESPRKRLAGGKKKAKKYINPDESPFIVIFDSLGRTSYQGVFKVLRQYIKVAAADKLGLTDLDTKLIVGCYAKVPTQDNFCDCGVYLISYIIRYLEHPNMFANQLLNKMGAKEQWFDEDEAANRRQKLRRLLRSLSREYAAHQKQAQPAGTSKGTTSTSKD